MKHANTKYNNGKWEFDPVAAEKYWNDAILDSEGVVRWKSNNQVPFDDMLNDFESLGKTFDRAKSVIARDGETAVLLDEYRERMKNVEDSPEHIAELRATFGAGVTFVNVVTGKSIKL